MSLKPWGSDLYYGTQAFPTTDRLYPSLVLNILTVGMHLSTLDVCRHMLVVYRWNVFVMEHWVLTVQLL